MVNDFKTMKLGEVFKTTSGGTPSRKNLSYYAGSIPWVKSGELKSNVIIDTAEKISEDGIKNSSAKIFPKGTLLIALYGATIGKLAMLGINAATNQAVCGIFENKEHVLQYLYYYLIYKRRKLIEAGIGGAQPNISQTILKNLEVPLPSKVTQLSIVCKIEELFSEIENGIKSLFTAKEQLKKYRQSVLKWAFEGKLTNDLNGDLYDLPGEYDLSVAAEPETEYQVERNHNNQKNQKNHSSDKGELPGRWKWVKIEEVASINPKLPKKDEINNDLEVQFLPMKLVEEIINKIHLIETRTFKEVQRGSYTPFVNGDIIFAKVTPCMENGKIAVVENLKNGIGYGSSEFHVLRCSKDASNKYVFYFLVQDRFRNEAQNAMTGAVGLRRVPKQFIENHLIPLPPFAEQNQIVQAIESRLSVADKMEESITESLQQAEALKQSILKKAFEGCLI